MPPTHMVTRSELGSSKKMAAILGLNLMHLLVENKLSSFHSEVANSTHTPFTLITLTSYSDPSYYLPHHTHLVTHHRIP